MKTHKTYTCWIEGKGTGQQILAEGKARSAKEFRNKVFESGNVVVSRIRIKKGLQHPWPEGEKNEKF